MKKLALMVVWGVAITAWLGLAGFYFTDPTTKEWTFAVGGVALATEIAFWVTAAILGVSLLAARKQVFGALSSPFRRG